MMMYRCWLQELPAIAAREIEANKPHSAALSLAREMWDSERWDGDEPLHVVVQNPFGLSVVYPITATLELQLKVGAGDVVQNSLTHNPRGLR